MLVAVFIDSYVYRTNTSAAPESRSRLVVHRLMCSATDEKHGTAHRAIRQAQLLHCGNFTTKHPCSFDTSKSPGWASTVPLQVWIENGNVMVFRNRAVRRLTCWPLLFPPLPWTTVTPLLANSASAVRRARALATPNPRTIGNSRSPCQPCTSVAFVFRMLYRES